MTNVVGTSTILKAISGDIEYIYKACDKSLRLLFIDGL